MKNVCKAACVRSIASAYGSILFVMLVFSSASGQAQRTFVSGLGSDGNPCTRAAPCRNFAQATSGTSAGGEVVVLDSAGYGVVSSITKSIPITAPPGGVCGNIGVFGRRDRHKRRSVGHRDSSRVDH
jgi:hypothetical protein